MDADRLLPGEDPQTPYLDDALHWYSVYTEMLQGKAAMLAALAERLTQMHEDEARGELGDTDAILLDRELKRFQRRIDFWSNRRLELQGPPQPSGDPVPG
ncbi:MAG: hypothetical protein WCB85_00820 [Candidatus Dormiibacterota bacterium]